MYTRPLLEDISMNFRYLTAFLVELESGFKIDIGWYVARVYPRLAVLCICSWISNMIHIGAFSNATDRSTLGYDHARGRMWSYMTGNILNTFHSFLS